MTARADAFVRTQAMLATTIAEIFVEPERVRVELEIGAGDLATFAGVLPDALHARLGLDDTPLAERAAGFFAETLVLRTGDGVLLRGGIEAIEGRERLRRDDISGEVRPRRDDEAEEQVLFVALSYPLATRPAELSIESRLGASVGFVAYHGGVAVNDFRYLTGRQRLQLDWDDPWYTRFESRSLRRQYDAPMSGFLYVEPYEVRKEIVTRPLELQRWVDLGLEGVAVIPPDAQEELLRRAAAFLREHHQVEIDGRAVPGELARIHFLERTLRTSRVIDPPEPLDVHAAVLGAIFVYPTEGLPERVTLDWDLWPERAERIPAATVDQAGSLPIYLERDWRVLEWQNFLQRPVLPTLRAIERPASAVERVAGGAAWLLLLAAAGLAALGAVRRRRGVLWWGVGCGLVATLGLVFGSPSRLSSERSAAVVEGLLHNVYRAFDYRDDERIYDTLAESVAGDLLEQIFLETRRGLELQSQGGARAKVQDVTLVSLDATPAADGAFTARTAWRVRGSVGHWGHVHQRENAYRAALRVAPIDGRWRLTEVEILEEERVDPGAP